MKNPRCPALPGETMVVLILLPKMAALVESVLTFVLGSAGLVMSDEI